MSNSLEGFPSGRQERVATILIVDDDALVRLTLSDYLQDHGFKVLEATTGDEALAILAAPGFFVDLVFTDVTMPGLTDGFALAKWMSENQPEIPIVVTSGDAKKAAAVKENGDSFQFVSKPYALDELAAQIRQTLSERPLTT